MTTQTPHPDDETIEAARAQATEYLGWASPRRVAVGGEAFVIPNPSLMDNEQQRRFDELQLSLEGLDRWPDMKNDAGEVVSMGPPKTPHRKGGQLEEHYDVKLTKALLGDAAAKRFFAKGGRASDIGLIWTEMNERTLERQRDDSKSASGDRHLAAVPDGD